MFARPDSSDILFKIIVRIKLHGNSVLAYALKHLGGGLDGPVLYYL